MFLFRLLPIVLLVFTFHCQSLSKKNVEINSEEQLTHRIWSGEIESPINPKHSTEMNQSWKLMLERREQITSYLQAKSFKAKGETVVYPFSGIDVLNLFSFFPKADRYVLFGLEDPGYPFHWESKKEGDRKIVLKGISELSLHLAGRNYFTYRKMKEETKKPALSGAYPVFVAFLNRLGKKVIGSKEELIQGNGIVYKGFTLVLFDELNQQEQSLTYYKIFLTGKEGVQGDGLFEYFSSLGEISIFTKSAEYLFHGEKRNAFRSLLLAKATFVVQDDSGFPIRFFPESTWERTLLGRYEKSWNLSGAIEPEFQAEMLKLSTEANQEPLPFPFGYGVLGSKKSNQSSILVLEKKN
ncbi:hypothetical protein LPTSP4_14210 [Leptospira ryugenii]|uniref:Uncharacterized protein n=1 Tax=Leptospira ryugenii TaxID=1917863 RepID=A0A2P2DZ41_9LEPT|nr:hypothetical protein [Leptospira ryugenii]GBF49901.1 hypothetical protein LPTSP4_14210 [Leptospira ryugenii]